MEEHQSKKVKMVQFWSKISTRQKKSEQTENWNLVHDSVLMKLYGLPLEAGSEYKVFAYDLDHTIISTNSGKILSKNPSDWKFLYPSVPKIIKETLSGSVKQVVFVIFSNQLNLNSKVAERAAFESKIDSIILKLGISNICPVITFFSTKRDFYRKPSIGMWNILKNEIMKKKQCNIKESESFFIGDAAGRIADWKPGKSADWSGVDRKFALNIGLNFYTPEEHFLNEDGDKPFDLGFHPKAFIITSQFDINTIFRVDSAREMIIVVGSPASGKSTFFSRFFQNKGYVRVNRDTLGTISKCATMTRSALSSGKSVYIDNTNPTRESRLSFLAIANDFQIPVRCFLFITDDNLCRHLNAFRSISQSIEPLPAIAFNSFKSNYQAPEINEGFESIIQIPFLAEFEHETDIDLFQQYLY